MCKKSNNCKEAHTFPTRTLFMSLFCHLDYSGAVFLLCDICPNISFSKEGQFYKVREICCGGRGRRKSRLDLGVYVNRCIWGDISVPVGDSGVFLGLDKVCVYHTLI